jgi:hypothetical protein
MPRQRRLDVPGVLHHVIGRGIERRKMFLDDRDRKEQRLGLGVDQSKTTLGFEVACPGGYLDPEFGGCGVFGMLLL